jgi:Inner membrane component of T3SS, cytoplasmic domain
VTEIVLQVFRFGFLLLLGLFIFAAFRVVRADLFGGRAGRVASVPPRATAVRGRKRGQRGQRGPRTLVVTAGPLTGTKITLGDQPILIGRADDSTLVLTDDFASSRHARLTNRGGQWYVEDLGSTNGTYLDQQRVQGPLLVGPGQPIRIGQTALELRT